MKCTRRQICCAARRMRKMLCARVCVCVGVYVSPHVHIYFPILIAYKFARGATVINVQQDTLLLAPKVFLFLFSTIFKSATPTRCAPASYATVCSLPLSCPPALPSSACLASLILLMMLASKLHQHSRKMETKKNSTNFKISQAKAKTNALWKMIRKFLQQCTGKCSNIIKIPSIISFAKWRM